MADEVPLPDHYDAEGRGPMRRAWDERCGHDPSKCGAGMAAFIKSMENARERQAKAEWPEQFRLMLARAVADVVGPMLEAERKEIESRVNALVDERLKPVREAYKELKAKVDRLERAGHRPALAGR